MTLSSSDVINIRAALEIDCDAIIKLIKDLAVYEGMPDQVKITAEDLRNDAFHATPPSVYILVAELTPVGTDEDSAIHKKIVGYALYYKTYSTWNGQALHLEDLFIQPEHRSKGVGDSIMKYLAKLSNKENYPRISWECINWNTSAIQFYKKYGAEDVTLKDHWHSYRFVNETLKKLASSIN